MFKKMQRQVLRSLTAHLPGSVNQAHDSRSWGVKSEGGRGQGWGEKCFKPGKEKYGPGGGLGASGAAFRCVKGFCAAKGPGLASATPESLQERGRKETELQLDRAIQLLCPGRPQKLTLKLGFGDLMSSFLGGWVFSNP